jgi:hypothetical protein
MSAVSGRRAVLDASVLLLAAGRDTLLRATKHELYVPFWSEQILEETRRNLVGKGFSSERQAARLLDILRREFPNAFVTGYESLIRDMPNHHGDRHVLAAAVHAGASFVVTENLRHFPVRMLLQYGVEPLSSDTFLSRLYDEHSQAMAGIVIQQAADLRSPPLTVAEVLNRIQVNAPAFAGRVASRFEATLDPSHTTALRPEE